jgi:hypothetical protein
MKVYKRQEVVLAWKCTMTIHTFLIFVVYWKNNSFHAGKTCFLCALWRCWAGQWCEEQWTASVLNTSHFASELWMPLANWCIAPASTNLSKPRIFPTCTESREDFSGVEQHQNSFSKCRKAVAVQRPYRRLHISASRILVLQKTLPYRSNPVIRSIWVHNVLRTGKKRVLVSHMVLQMLFQQTKK